ncbi:MAG: hypothetical protein OXC63_10515 [Aestuariivita sp.]|nr:hypothetical protein [Aestuariivita sp.]MCY4347455.1 hypothetical protein [Aestuariivita sp.]
MRKEQDRVTETRACGEVDPDGTRYRQELTRENQGKDYYQEDQDLPMESQG